MQIRRCVSAAVLVLMMASMLSLGRALVFASQRVSTSVDSGKYDYITGELSRRLSDAEKKIDALVPDVAVMKSDMFEVKWIARGAAGLVVAQVLMTAFGLAPLRRRKIEGGEAAEV